MVRIKPFRAWRPRQDLVSRVVCPPYDVVSTDEAAALARGNPISFLHVIRSEIDLEKGISPYDPRVYRKAAENLRRLIEEGGLVREEEQSLYVYQQKVGDHVQAGLVFGASVEDYLGGRIKRHEQTRAEKEEDRTRHIQTTGMNTGPVFLCYRERKEVDRIVDSVRSGSPLYDLVTEDGVTHTVWRVSDGETIGELKAAFSRVPELYIADGHHRAASSVRVAVERRRENPGFTGEEPWNYFLAVAFPHDQLMVFGYHRVVRDLGGLAEEEFLERTGRDFEVLPDSEPLPRERGRFGMFFRERWWGLAYRNGDPEEVADPVKRLDVAVLQNHLLGPVLGIHDPRRDERIDFVGGIRGPGELERRCREEGWALAFTLYPTSVEELMAVADAGRMMPPKSTWFEPKLRSGLLVRSLDDD